jgi:hypothetical protein
MIVLDNSSSLINYSLHSIEGLVVMSSLIYRLFSYYSIDSFRLILLRLNFFS